MQRAGLPGAFRRRRGCTTRDPAADRIRDLANRRFTVDASDLLWCMDIAQHRTREG